MEIVFEAKLFSTVKHDARNLINVSSYLMDLHEVFKGTYLAERVARHAKSILLRLLGVQGQGQEQELSRWC